MSQLFINQYHQELERLKKFGATQNETSINAAFLNLVNQFAKPKNLLMVRELEIKFNNQTIRPDGILRNELTFDCGYWESKDPKDDLDKEIKDKIRKGYPTSNIIFENSEIAVLYQQGREIARCSILDGPALEEIINAFIQYERPEVLNFRRAIEQFSQDLPQILVVLRQLIQQASQDNPAYVLKRDEFLTLCQESINPKIDRDDVREMLIQHILTEEIFVSIFSNADYHRENNIANVLYEVERSFFKGETKQNLLKKIRPYYETIKARASQMVTHSDKQQFLKIVYENFYKSYNPKGADRLGIVYTPNEIVKFMIQGTDYLLDKHFNKTLGSQGVEILDPCTGTGTFITEIIEHIPKHQLAKKYQTELHANEMALLPYYIANLNIELVYQAKMEDYKEFKNLCFVDTLDNINALNYIGKQNDMFGSFSMENVERIKRQNDKKISVIIGNPPYNANQQNENENNKNREYPYIDKRIKETYIRASTAQKTKVYDMYARFYRWAMDRMNQNGVLSFVTNRSFLDSRTFDGFRKIVQKEFTEIWIYDTQSDVRANPKIAGSSHNVFGIQTGVCIAFFVKNEQIKNAEAKIYYFSLNDEMRKEEKLAHLSALPFAQIPFERLNPDAKANWLNLTENDFEALLPLCSKNPNEKTIFEFSTLGVNTARDEWVYDFDKTNLEHKIQFFFDFFIQEKERWKNSDKQMELTDFLNRKIKFSDSLNQHLSRFAEWEENLQALQALPPNGKAEKIRKIKRNLSRYKKWKYSSKNIISSNYRPFVKKYYYADNILSDRLTKNHYKIFGKKLKTPNQLIGFSAGSRIDFSTIASKYLPNLATFSLDPARWIPLYYYEGEERKENVSDWALASFRQHYQNLQDEVPITKTAIFNYVYAVLHDPTYRNKYEQNLKRDFPRLPFYPDFWLWAKWGETLMDLHINYENIKPQALERLDLVLKNQELPPKPKLKVDKVQGIIFIDEITSLKNVPPPVWDYKLGSRSAIEWVLDQYKDKKSNDPTLMQQFHTSDLAQHKEVLIELLQKLCALSLQTQEIIQAMQAQSTKKTKRP